MAGQSKLRFGMHCIDVFVKNKRFPGRRGKYKMSLQDLLATLCLGGTAASLKGLPLAESGTTLLEK